MTTTVTLKTHGWPVEVTLTDDYEYEAVRHHGETVETVPPHSQKDFHATSTRSLHFKEMPAPAPTPPADDGE